MPNVPEVYNVGDESELTPELLLEMLEDMYQTLASAVNLKADCYTREVNGTPTDGQTDELFHSIGDININTDSEKVEVVVSRTATAIVWKEI